MDLKVPIVINDELTEEVVQSNGLLNLASGEIQRLEYLDYDVAARGEPWESEDYEFTSGTLSNNGRDVEFRIEVNRMNGQCSASANELLEIKVRAAALFAGMSAPEMLHASAAKERAAKAAAKSPGSTPARPRGRGPAH